MMVPMADTDIVRFPVRLPTDLHEGLKGLATRHHRSLHSEILVALEEYVTEHAADLVEAARSQRRTAR